MRALTWIEITIGAVCVLIILVLVFTQALQRYLAGGDIAWTGELSKFGLVWLTFSVIGVLVTSREHIALEIVDVIPNRMIVRIIQVLALLIVAATGLGLSTEALALVETSGIIKSPVLRMPMSWVYIPVLVGVVSMTIRALVAAIDVAWHGPVIAEPENDSVEAPIA
ncbi:TRAP transporter small permease [Paramicrobacterium fandaimingii]|uniref:TRAP transporter small permease n=1 Tax=Paramicrobacterium fandaimingii TaxID=2708079 RepID=UPI00189D023A|nr:TRAP transporter small permease subunit [Microbacterium fandaimingii]